MWKAKRKKRRHKNASKKPIEAISELVTKETYKCQSENCNKPSPDNEDEEPPFVNPGNDEEEVM